MIDFHTPSPWMDVDMTSPEIAYRPIVGEWHGVRIHVNAGPRPPLVTHEQVQRAMARVRELQERQARERREGAC